MKKVLSWISAAQRRDAEKYRSQWNGAQWREQRSEFKLHLYQVAAAQGVAFDA